MGWKDWQVGEVVTESDFQSLVQNQVVQVYADSSARTTALGTAVADGMVSYLTSTDSMEIYNGSAWVSVSNPGDITAVTPGTALTGGGTAGDVTLDVDLSVVQPNVITTQGDLVVGDASGDAARLALGTATQVLTSNGTTAVWADAAGGGGGGDITSVIAGTALTGGGTTGDVTLDVNLAAITIPQSQVTDLTTDLAAKVSTTNGTVTTAATGSNVVRNITLSTSAPTGGSDGDVWLVYTA